MSHFAVLRTRRGIAAIAIVVGVVVGALLIAFTGDDDESAPTSAPTRSSTTPTPVVPTPSATATPSPTPAATARCEGPDTISNPDGVRQDSLLPDCGSAPVSAPEQEKKGLGLGCGGTYPVILYKTTTDSSKSSICGVNSSGEKLRVVVAPDGGAPKDLAGRYEYQLDAFVAKDGDTTYTIRAYDGTLLIKRDGSTTTQTSNDWISLDNESDYD